MIGYYQIKSPLSHATEQNAAAFIGRISNSLGEELCRVGASEYADGAFSLLYVASGGSEGYFPEVFERLKGKPCYILTSGESNSLAASLEILSYLKKRGGNGTVLHGDDATVAQRIRALSAAHRAKSSLNGKKLGLIGEPSSWLIASDYDEDAVERKLGLGLLRISIDELLSEIAAGGYEENAYTEKLTGAVFDRDELRRALDIYGAFYRIVNRYGLCGLSVRCFDLLDTVRSTGCLGLSILNSLGVYGGCEGDMPSLLSMAILGEVTGKDTFMCNPSRIDASARRATFAHCTVPVTMTDGFSLDTHFESGIGVAVKGRFDGGDCTLFKCSGDLSRYYASEGVILDEPYSDALCRTQITVGADGLSYFLNDPIGNHHVICRGHNKDALDAFFGLLDS